VKRNETKYSMAAQNSQQILWVFWVGTEFENHDNFLPVLKKQGTANRRPVFHLVRTFGFREFTRLPFAFSVSPRPLSPRLSSSYSILSLSSPLPLRTLFRADDCGDLHQFVVL